MMQKNEDVKWGAGLFVPEDKIIFEQEVVSGKAAQITSLKLKAFTVR